jgi:Na+-transporting methylmalonyl-CoA/oxaloacetate decarboxylase gamma subunit
LPDALVFLIVLAILALVVTVVSAPVRRARRGPPAEAVAAGPDGDSFRAGELAELEAAREAKYREIRDAELDLETGKLSQSDFEAIDQALRGEAIEILNALERVRGG